MDKKERIRLTAAAASAAAGIALGMTWPSGTCLGDGVFAALGLPA